VEELANRAISLEHLLQFYRRLGKDVMGDFDPRVNTTFDVVQQAIIPLTAPSRRSLAEDLMGESATRPDKMVTHNWSNLFRDLMAAVIADALNEESYAIVAFFLDNSIDTIEEFLRDTGKLNQSYWICAFSVNQHISICECADCQCGSVSISNDTPPLNSEGQSIPCEMNKFDDMMELLAASNVEFEHVIAVDKCFDLFDRAWCIAEIYCASKMGMRQHVKPFSLRSLESNQTKLNNLRIEEMRATRMEDVQYILSKIHDKDAFNTQLHDLIFKSLLADWGFLDSEQRMACAGKLLRWEHVLGAIGVCRNSEESFHITEKISVSSDSSHSNFKTSSTSHTLSTRATEESCLSVVSV
jgi:hypothetical protein